MACENCCFIMMNANGEVLDRIKITNFEKSPRFMFDKIKQNIEKE